MTQTDIPTWCFTFQQKLMAALDAAWAILDRSDDPAEIRRAATRPRPAANWPPWRGRSRR